MKFYRPSLAINYGSEEVGQMNQIRSQDTMLGSKIMHTKVVWAPDGVTGNVQPDAVLQPKLNLAYPTSWQQGIDDGKTFVNHKATKSFTRVFKPLGVEKRWRGKGVNSSSEFDDTELSFGGINLRFKTRNALDILNANENQWHTQDDAAILSCDATIYAEYTERY
jgi:hypothetical protein